ncbi:hypothetical protein F5B22DRAFT_591406 [Xylaria bambusicola]|uniref:uncharacterized protein n=1 Tax=Xylaria bambusicola TaxID=326684 RepID=UPI0020076150|nr:uncharacterized protein F5B22DRAFT_591406 [Xylaria bambusicola]KAI0523645.1 hypothetical protein F5B22DRAFT_591406 [Xylaria bambusicola]
MPSTRRCNGLFLILRFITVFLSLYTCAKDTYLSTLKILFVYLHYLNDPYCVYGYGYMATAPTVYIYHLLKLRFLSAR